MISVRQKIERGALVGGTLVASTLGLVKSVGAAGPEGILTDFPPSHTPPTQVDRCYRYDIGIGYEWQNAPYGGRRVFYEQGWGGEAVWVGDRWVMRESFGVPCPEN